MSIRPVLHELFDGWENDRLAHERRSLLRIRLVGVLEDLVEFRADQLLVLHECGRDCVDRVLLLTDEALRLLEELLKQVVDQQKNGVRIASGRSRRCDHERRAHPQPSHVDQGLVGGGLKIAACSGELRAEHELLYCA